MAMRNDSRNDHTQNPRLRSDRQSLLRKTRRGNYLCQRHRGGAMSLPSLDVFIGLVTIYLVLALTVSALTEIISRLVGLRSIGLKSGIRSILQGPDARGLADETKRFWNSGIIKSATDGDPSPNSLDPQTFATATLATTGLNLSGNAGQAAQMIANAPI